MARKYMMGAELQATTAGVEWETTTGSPSINTSIKNGGAASMRTNPSAATAFIRQTWQTDTVNTHYEKFDFYIATASGANTYIWQYLDSGNSIGFALQITSGRVVNMINNAAGTTVLASSSALSTAAWHSIQIKIVDHATTSAQFELKIDGSTIASLTGLTGVDGGGRSSIGFITSGTGDFYFDNWLINDTTGSAETGYPDQNEIVAVIVPDGTGDNNGWANATGGTAGAANNFTRVNQIPPDDATTYNMVNSAGTFTDDFTCGSSSGAGIGSGDTIKCIQVRLRGGSTATTTGATINTRIKSAAGGTTTTATGNDAYNVNGWRTDGASPAVPDLTSYLDPTTGSAWTPTGTNSIDNMQIGYVNAASNTTVRRVSGVYAMIGYVAASGNNWNQPLSDSVTATDDIVKSPTKKPADSVTATDAFDRTVAYIRALSDTANSTDAISNRPALVKSDSVSTSDATAKTVGKFVADTATATDNRTTAQGYNRTLSDTATTTDAVSKAVGKFLADSVSTADNLSAIKLLMLDLSDSVTTSDANSKAVGLNKADTASTSDNATTSQGFARAFSDTATTSDAISKGMGKALADALTVSDATAKAIGISKADQVALNDVLAKFVSLLLDDTVTATDAFNFVIHHSAHGVAQAIDIILEHRQQQASLDNATPNATLEPTGVVVIIDKRTFDIPVEDDTMDVELEP